MKFPDQWREPKVAVLVEGDKKGAWFGGASPSWTGRSRGPMR